MVLHSWHDFRVWHEVTPHADCVVWTHQCIPMHSVHALVWVCSLFHFVCACRTTWSRGGPVSGKWCSLWTSWRWHSNSMRSVPSIYLTSVSSWSLEVLGGPLLQKKCRWSICSWGEDWSEREGAWLRLKSAESRVTWQCCSANATAFLSLKTMLFPLS